MTTERLKTYSIEYLVQFVEMAQSKRSRINVLTPAGLIEGKIMMIEDDTSGIFPDFIKGMLHYYEKEYDLDDPFMDKQKNTFITFENAVLKSGGVETNLKYLIVYLDEIVGIALSEKID
ncbi:hypothetical protein J0B03_09795 [Alkalibacter rhizosphaerae]|uniref:Uncharacterized protein n=1 Tax=Alkalibacter rhizosphaerae TaxID=2815577 RepID=A0A974XDY0_9FIRM|nr:hypothetical protein [Alkalibacter rhizosphaerae]QSX08082.1 hypothetical protein J0B03_09795 [Alkalibacter rhizosphaerae]